MSENLKAKPIPRINVMRNRIAIIRFSKLLANFSLEITRRNHLRNSAVPSNQTATKPTNLTICSTLTSSSKVRTVVFNISFNWLSKFSII